MENLYSQIVEQYAHYLHVNLNESYHERQPLPKFSAYAKNGRLIVFAGKLSETEYGMLVKACEVFGYSNVALGSRKVAA